MRPTMKLNSQLGQLMRGDGGSGGGGGGGGGGAPPWAPYPPGGIG